MKFPSIDARRVSSDHDGDLSPGEFCWGEDDDGNIQMAFMLPGDEWHFLREITCYRKGDPKPKSPAWEWDGNEDKPTLTPSISSKGAPDGKTTIWHGHLTAGRFEACE